LTFSRRQILEPIDLNLNVVVKNALKMLVRLIGENIDLKFAPCDELMTVHADKGQIEQVLMNLCVNARDAMPTGGTLNIETGNVVFDDAYCAEHDWAELGTFVRISIVDSGLGMDEATRARIFEPFFTTKGLGQGTGLGLSVVYGIVKQHHGLLHASSELGKGTAFDIYFPAVNKLAQMKATETETQVTGGTETILVAEDEDGIRNLLVRMLRSEGYTVLGACNGEDALSVFENHSDEIDLAILDVVMPKLGGREVMDRIQAKNSRIRFLFSSGYSTGSIHTNFIIDEGLHLVSKPYRRPELLRVIRRILDGPTSI
jgi:CheY-like chemotaxis protein